VAEPPDHPSLHLVLEVYGIDHLGDVDRDPDPVDPDALVRRKRLAVDPVEAECVRLIYKLYLYGDGTSGALGVKEVVKWLNRNGYRTRRGETFGVAAVRVGSSARRRSCSHGAWAAPGSCSCHRRDTQRLYLAR
jgi:hypothetical protein